MPKLAMEPWIGAIKANDEARKTGTVTRVTPWKMRVPTPAVNSATLGSSPVSSGTSTKAPNATNSICAPVRITLSGESFDNCASATDSFIGVFPLFYIVQYSQGCLTKTPLDQNLRGVFSFIVAIGFQ